MAIVEGGNSFSGMHNNVRLNSFKQFPVTRYICCTCGYTEEWIDNKEHLDKLFNKHGVSDDFDEFV